MGKIAAISVLVVLFGITGAASGTIFTIELPELVGELEPYPNHPTAAFDFGTSFLSIDEVRIQLSGIFTPRVVRSSITGESLELTPEIELYMDPGVGYCSVFVYPLESPFDVEGTFVLRHVATWDFLLDGTDELTAGLLWGVSVGGVTITPGSVEISQAYLTVEGVIPEPATLFLVGLGGLFLVRRREKHIEDRKRFFAWFGRLTTGRSE